MHILSTQLPLVKGLHRPSLPHYRRGMAQLFFVSVQPKVARRQGLEKSLRCIGTPLTACTTGPKSTPHGHWPAKLFLLHGVQPNAPNAKELDERLRRIGAPLATRGIIYTLD